MAETWEQRLLALLDPDQVRRGDTAIVAAIDALSAKLDAVVAAGGAAGSGSGSHPTSGSAGTSSRPAWVTGAGASAKVIPIVVRPSGQALSVPPELASTLTGGTLTFLSGAAAGQSGQIQSITQTGVVTLASPLPLVPGAGDQVAMIGALGASTPGVTTLAPLTTHLPIPTFHTVGTTAIAITLADYTTALPSSVELWNRGSTDLYVNFNGDVATGDTDTSTDEHLAPNETWSGNVQVKSLSVISSAAGGLFECQFWGS